MKKFSHYLLESKPKSIHFKFQSAVGRIDLEPNSALVTGIESSERGKGHAHGVMKLITRYLDDHKLASHLIAVAIDDDVTTSGLQKLYAQHGFVKDSKHPFRMVRNPK